jgi:hypothetical protein
MSDTTTSFITGTLTTGYLVLTLFFLKFWRRTNDRFFLYFSCAFFLMGASEGAFALAGGNSENTDPFIYLLRLLAFVLIIVAIVRKNVEARR